MMNFRRLAACAALFASLLLPFSAARAFEAQSTWGGTAGGTANAVTVAIANVQSLNDVLGVPLRFVPASDNTGPATISINGLTATAARRPSNIGLVALSGGELQAGVTTTIMYNGATIELLGPLDMTPIGRTVEFRGSVTPRGTLIEDGSCVSVVTYAALFSVIGRNYGACDGTTTFGLPRSNGRAFVALDNQGAGGAANTITSAGSGCNATTIGDCGSQNQTLSIANINSFTPGVFSAVFSSGAATIPVFNLVNVAGSTDTGHLSLGNSGNSSAGSFSAGITVNGTVSVTMNALGSGTPHAILNPISLGRRAIKY